MRVVDALPRMWIQRLQPKVVSERLGHASVATTMDIYSHVIPELEDEAVKKVAEKFLGNQRVAPRYTGGELGLGMAEPTK